MTEFIRLQVCVNCLMYAAGMDEHETAQDMSACIAAHRRVADDNHLQPQLVQLVPASAMDDDESEADFEPFFSWSRCEFCLSALGGDRYPADLILDGAL